MMSEGNTKICSTIPTYIRPPRLTWLAADIVIRLLVYEDYQDCNFYKWDPVRIWMFEAPQIKKKSKKSKNQDSPYRVNSIDFGHPPPPWKELIKLRNWWCNESSELLGHLIDSPIRHLIISALERQSWTAKSEEEEILFLLLRLFFDIQLHINVNLVMSIPSQWCHDLSQIIDNLGPFPIQKLTIDEDMFIAKPGILSTIIQNSPHLQILRIGQWELNNLILNSVRKYCPLLQEFCISRMEPDVFMSDVALFECFFNGMLPEQVLDCYRTATSPSLSFKNLKYVDLLFCRQTERLIQMLSYFYPRVSLSSYDVSNSTWRNIADPFLKYSAKIPFLRVTTRTSGILDKSLTPLISHSSFLRELRLHIDDNFPNSQCDAYFHRKMNEAGESLRDYIRQLSNLDSLSIRPHCSIDIIPVILPSLSHHGNNIKHLHFVFDLGETSTNTIYQLLNLCPFLDRLTLCLSIFSRDAGSKTFVTELKELIRLETFVISDIRNSAEEEKDSCEPLAYIALIKDILFKAPNLKNFSFTCWEDLLTFYELGSSSIKNIHINFSHHGDKRKALSSCNHWLKRVLPKFPYLQVFSFEGEFTKLWSECIPSLLNREILITKKKQEFANVFRWEENNNFSNHNAIFVM